jgi:hypothetical protein
MFTEISADKVNKIIGYILLMPAVSTVFMFIWDVVLRKTEYIREGGVFKPYWYLWAHPEHWTSHLVLFVGITAAVGAYLVKTKN